jgi:hypothetical protein
MKWIIPAMATLAKEGCSLRIDPALGGPGEMVHQHRNSCNHPGRLDIPELVADEVCARVTEAEASESAGDEHERNDGTVRTECCDEPGPLGTTLIGSESHILAESGCRLVSSGLSLGG